MSTNSGRSSDIDRGCVDNPYSVWTCSLTSQERNLGLGVIVRLDSGDKGLQSLLPCLGAKLRQQKVNLQTNYALLTCHSNLDVIKDDHEPKYFILKGLQACVDPARRDSNVIALEDCVSCAVSCCGPTSMLMLSSSNSARVQPRYSLLPHTGGHCPIGYDFVILFLNNRFEPGETTPPPVVNVSQYLDLRTRLAWQSGAQARSSATAGEFYLCSRQKSGFNMVPVKVPYSGEEREVKRFCDEIDWYKKHQRFEYKLDSQSSGNGAPIIYCHEGKGNLVGISSTGNQVVTLYGICQLLAGGPIPLFAAMRHPKARTLSPYRWSHHILSHLGTGTMTNKGYLIEIFYLLVEKEDSEEGLVNLNKSNVSETAMEILSEILKKFSGPEELKEVVRKSCVFEPPNMSEDDFKGCILRVCKRLKSFMHHFSSFIPQDTEPKKILEYVFRCTETMLYWSSQYPDVAETLLSNENVESAATAAENYQDSQSINNSFKVIRQCHDIYWMMKQELERQKATLQQEIEELKKKEISEDHMEKNFQSKDASLPPQKSSGKRRQYRSCGEGGGETGPSPSKKSRRKDVIPMTQRTGRQELTNRVPGNEAGPSTSLISRPSRGEDASPRVQRRHSKRSQKQSCGEGDGETGPSPSKKSRRKDLASRYAAGLESEPELSELMNEIASRIPDKWRPVGIALGLTINELSCFSANEDPSRCFTFVFTIWRSRMTREPYSWGTVVEVLRSPSVGELKMAEQLKKRLTNQN